MNGWRPPRKSFRAGAGWRPPRGVSSVGFGKPAGGGAWRLAGSGLGGGWQPPAGGFRLKPLGSFYRPGDGGGVNTNVPPALLPGKEPEAPAGPPAATGAWAGGYGNMPGGLLPTPQGLWNVRTQTYVTPEEAAQWLAPAGGATQQLVPGLGLVGPTPQQIQEQQQTSRYQNMGQAGIAQTARGLWNVREQRYLTPEEAAAFGG